MEECSFLPVSAVWGLLKLDLRVCLKKMLSNHYWSSENLTKNYSFQGTHSFYNILHLRDVLSSLLVMNHVVTSQTPSAHTSSTRFLYMKVWLHSMIISCWCYKCFVPISIAYTSYDGHIYNRINTCQSSCIRILPSIRAHRPHHLSFLSLGQRTSVL